MEQTLVPVLQLLQLDAIQYSLCSGTTTVFIRSIASDPKAAALDNSCTPWKLLSGHIMAFFSLV